MRIAVNTRFLLKDKLEGFGWYTYETLNRMVRAHPRHQFFFFFDRPYAKEFVFAPNVTPVVLLPPARHPILFKIWFNLMVPLALIWYRAQVFLSPDGYVSLTTSIPQLAVIHDLAFEHYPADIPPHHLAYLKKYSPQFAHRATRIITVSEYSRQDIIARYKIDAQKVDVSWNGVNPGFVPLSQEEQQKVRVQWSHGTPYFVYVGSFHPRKNIARLVQAFDRFIEQTGADVHLLLVGRSMYWTPQMQEAWNALRHKNRIKICSSVGANDLRRITASALAMVYVSYFEGFGIPVAEAFACGTPVITSNRSSLPEVAGNAALIIDPFMVHEITNAMEKLYQDPALREELSAKGLKRAPLFNWDFTARDLWQSLCKTQPALGEDS